MSSRESTVYALREALEAVDAADLPQDLRAAGFAAAIRLNGASPASAPEPRSGAGNTHDPATDAETNPLVAFAERLRVSVDVVQAVFYVDGEGRPAIELPRRRLDDGRAQATRQLAILVAAARQFDAAEQFTSTDSLRDVCQDFGVYDQANFARTITAMSDVFQFQGSGRERKVRLSRPGFDEASTLTKALAHD